MKASFRTWDRIIKAPAVGRGHAVGCRTCVLDISCNLVGMRQEFINIF